MPTNQTFGQVVDLASLIGAPLVAVIEADSMTAVKFLKFIERYGFEQIDPSDVVQPSIVPFGRLKTVEFTYVQRSLDGSQETVTMSIPLLSLVPLPLLQISDAEFEFDIRVVDAVSEDDSFPPLNGTPTTPTDTATVSPIAPEVTHRFRAMLARRAPNAQSETAPTLDANMVVKVNMQRADVPAGIAALLNTMGEAVQGYNTPPTPPGP
jgi:hypothetical protein